MKKKVSADTQLMAFAEEELQLKKKMVEKMDCLAKEHAKTMSDLSSSLKTLSDSISSAFTSLNQVLLPNMYQQPLAPRPVPPHPNYTHHYNMQVPSSMSYFCPVSPPLSIPTSQSHSLISSPSSMPQTPQNTYDDVPVLTPIHFDDSRD